MSVESILSGITGISDGGNNTASEFRDVLTDMTETLSGDTPISSGIISNEGLSGNTIDTGKFDLGVVKGWIVDNTTNPEVPSVRYINYSGSTDLNPSGITLTYLATNPVTYIGLTGNTSNDIIQSTNKFTQSEYRDVLVLGVVIHSNNVIVNAINNAPVLAIDPTMQIYDIMTGLGFFNISSNSNLFSANGANLGINKTEGEIFANSSNYINDPKNPHIKLLPSLTLSTFRYRLQDSTEYGDTQDIDPNNYDNGSVLTLVPQNKFTIQRITLFTSNLVRIQYGQNIYDSIDDAEATLSTESFIEEANISENGLLRGFIILKEGATKLNDNNQAKFIECNHFGDAHDTVVGNVHRTSIINHSSTTLRRGGVISINSGDNSLIDISSGEGIITDNTTNPSNPTFTQVNWETITGITIDNLIGDVGSLIFININGEVVQFPNTLESNGSEGRSYITLGGIGHTNNLNITSVFNIPVHNLSPINIFSDFVTAIGPFSISGNRISGEAGTKELNKSSGRSYYYGSNYQVDNANPDLLSVDSLIQPPLVIATGEKILGFSGNTIDTDNYDPNGLGVITALLEPNKSIAHRIWHEPSSNFLIFQYGQIAYKDINAARDSFISEDFITPSSLESIAYLVAVLITDGDSNSSNLDDALFIPQGKFTGGGGGGSVDTLQSVYNNSNNPEILTDSIKNSVDFRVGSGSDSDNVVTIQNNAGDINALITGEGYISGSTVDGDVILSGGTNLMNIFSTDILRNVSGSTTILINDSTLNCTETITTTLPTAIGVKGKKYRIKNSGIGIITIDTTISQTIDGALTATLVTQYESITVQSNGSNWIII